MSTCWTGQVIFGLEVTDPKTGQSKILLNPGSLIIPMREQFEVHGFVIAKDEVCRQLRSHDVRTHWW